jgi:hypothetical protein
MSLARTREQSKQTWESCPGTATSVGSCEDSDIVGRNSVTNVSKKLDSSIFRVSEFQED